MWKCFNRGVRETIDRGVSVFKADTSNGTCLISSLAKDIDDLSTKSSIRCERSTNCGEHLRRNDVDTEGNVQCEHGTQIQFARHRNVNPRSSSEDFQFHDDYHLKSVAEARRTSHNAPVSPRSKEVSKLNDDCDQSSGIFTSYSSKDHASSRNNDVKTSECGRPTCQGSKWLQKVINRPKSSHILSETSKLKTHSLGVIPLHTDATGKSHQPAPALPVSGEGQNVVPSGTLPISENDFSIRSRNHNFNGKNNVLTPNESSQLQSGNSYCLLKLPFLSYDVGCLSSWSKVSSGWLMKRRSEFGKGNNGSSGGDRGGESEETREDAWRHYEMHKSFLEAIGWSSALLFGWFFGHCRMRLMIGDSQNDNDMKQQRKCCVIGSVTKLLKSWRFGPCAPLKVLPSEADGISKRPKGVHAAESVANESLVETETYVQFETLSSSNEFFHGKAEPSTYQSNSVKQKFHVVNPEMGSVIPMPWHSDVAEKVAYGPITFEEALKEAGKGLDEAQSEVLLALALEKLDEEVDNSVLDGPLAAELLQSAASLGNTAAAFNLGICYEKGLGGVIKNLMQAYHWYKQASDKGHGTATYNLAVFHANGLAGLHPNTYLANQLLMKASLLGQPEAIEALSFLSSLETSESFCGSEDDLTPEECGVILSQNEQENVITLKVLHPSTLLQSKEVGGANILHSTSNVPYDSSKNITSSSVGEGLKAKSLEHGKECRAPQLEPNQFLKSFGLPVSGHFDIDEEHLVDELFDNIFKVKNSAVDSNSVELLAH